MRETVRKVTRVTNRMDHNEGKRFFVKSRCNQKSSSTRTLILIMADFSYKTRTSYFHAQLLDAEEGRSQDDYHRVGPPVMVTWPSSATSPRGDSEPPSPFATFPTQGLPFQQPHIARAPPVGKYCTKDVHHY